MSVLRPWKAHPSSPRVTSLTVMVTVTVTVMMLALALGVVAVPSPATAAPVDPLDGVIVQFDGETLDLADGWGDATACMFDGVTAQCFHSELAMDRALNTFTRPGILTTRSSSCSSSLRLYDGAYQLGPVLLITARYTPINLSVVGFDNVTSSYRVGACDANLYNGQQSWRYPGDTSAFAGANTMLPGWNNSISSVYLL
jgi:hypothetical protein